MAFVKWLPEWLHSNQDLAFGNRRVAALVDIKPEIHDSLRKKLDCYGSSDTKLFTSLEDALCEFGPDDADSVMIAASNTAHAELTEIALRHGRHVFLEKPIAADWNDTTRIVRAVEKRPDLVVMLGFVMREAPFYRKIKEIVSSGFLGTPVVIQMNERLSLNHATAYRRGWRRLERNTGGFINEKASHDLDLMRWMKAPVEPVEVFSCGGKQLFPPKPEAPEKCEDCPDVECPFRRGKAELEKMCQSEFFHSKGQEMDILASCIYNTDADVLNHQSAVFIFADGTQGVFTLTAYSAEEDNRDIIIHGTEGFLTGDLESGRIKLTKYRGNKTETIETCPNTTGHGGGDEPLIRRFFSALDGKKELFATVRDGMEASRMAFAANRSVAEKRLVKLSEFQL